MKKLLAFLLILTLLTGAGYAEDALSGMLEKAEAFLSQEDYESAAICLDIARKLDPMCAEIYALEAKTREIMGDIEGALRCADEALALSPANGEMYLLRSKLLSLTHRPDEAETALKYARICGVSSDFEARIALAEAYAAEGRYGEALLEFDFVPMDLWMEKDGELFKKALLRTGNAQRARELGLYTVGEKDETLRRKVESGKISVTPMEIGEALNAPFFCSVAYFEQNKDEMDELSASVEFAPDGKRVKAADHVLDLGADEENVALLTASPSGETLMIDLDGVLCVYRNGEITAIMPNPERGAQDAGKNQLSYLMTGYGLTRFMDQDSFAWSHSERYVAVTFGNTALQQFKFFDLMIADTFTGEIFLANATPGKIMDGAQGALFAAFDEEDEYVYYIAYGAVPAEDARCGLYRYSLETGETEFLYADSELIDFAGLYETSDGSWYAVTDVINMNEAQALKKFIRTAAGWTAETVRFPLTMEYGRVNRFLYSDNSGLALLTNAGGARYFRILNAEVGADGAGEAVILPETFTGSAEKRTMDEAFAREMALVSGASVSDNVSEEREAALEKAGLTVLSAALSPDGFFALILTCDNGGEVGAWVLDMETLRLAEIELPEDVALLPIGTSAGRNKASVLSWLDGTRVLLPTTDGGLLCELALD